MKELLKKVSRFDTVFRTGIMNIAQMVIVIFVLVNAMCRYLLRINLSWSEEVVLFAAYYLYFAGIAEAEKQDRQLSASMISLFTKNEKVIYFFKVVKQVFSLVICLFATVWSVYFIQDTLRLNPKSMILKYPVLWNRIPELICFILMDIYIVGHLVRLFKSLKEGKAGEE